ncbi:MAG: transcription elongation factor GreA [Acholeplasmatales bacterium]|nr:MAG: transcription elongation factor GreA [Acholeplasmatales bacterium]
MDQNGKYKLTQSGIEKLKAELHLLKTVEREANLEALKEARAQGDLTENADYDAAREEQARIEKRIKELEVILKNVELIGDNDRTNKVTIGKTVTLKIGKAEPSDYRIVGTLEADPLNHRISNESPIGKAVIGKKKGDEIKVKTETQKEILVTVVDVK